MTRFLFMAVWLFSIPMASADDSDFAGFLGTFASKEGRIIDTGNGNISHSEGQGYGLLFAEAANDAATFDRIWKWTQKTLQIRNDALLAWKWEPRGSSGIVTDMNNATDGDILVAWALFRGAKRWGNKGYRAEARKILADVQKLALVPSAFGPLILPGINGFKKGEAIVVNPSYWVFPAFATFAREDPSTDWQAVSQSGEKLIRQGQFSRWKLPPDWLLVSGAKLSLAGQFPPEFGYNAIRVPLHLVWNGQKGSEWFSGYRSYRDTFESLDAVKATVSLPKSKPGPNPVLPGMAKIYRLIGTQGDAGSDWVPAPEMPPIHEQAYYSAALSLLTELAVRERPQE